VEVSPSPAPTPALTPPPAPPQPESEGQYLIAIFSIVFGGLLLFAALVLAVAGGASEGGALPRYRYVAAVGAGLLALGLALEYERIIDLLRQRKSLHAVNAVIMSVLALIVVVLVNVLSTRYDFWRKDLTSEGVFTLSDEARAEAAALDRDIHITVLMPLAEDPQFEPIRALLEQYEAASPRIAIERIELRKIPPREWAVLVEKLGLPVRDETELVGVVVQSGAQGTDGWKAEKSEHIRLQDMWEEQEEGKTFLGEQKISSAMKNVLQAKKPKLYFLAGHEEPGLDAFGDREGLGYLSRLLRPRNLELASVNLSQVATVPDDCDLLIVGGPRGPLSPSEVEKVTAYLDRGGDAIVCLEPVFGQRGGVDGMIEVGLEGYLREEYGVSAETRELVRFEPTTGGPVVARNVFADEHDRSHPLTEAIGRMAQPITVYVTARTLTAMPGTAAKEVVKVSENFASSYYIMSTADPHKVARERRPPADRQGGPFAIAVASEKAADTDAAKKSRLLVVGDVDWLSNQAMMDSSFENLELFLRAADWAQDRQSAVVGKARRPRSYRLSMAPETFNVLQLASLVGLPALSICLAMFAWLLRRR
jgi:hypothetical protein